MKNIPVYVYTRRHRWLSGKGFTCQVGRVGSIPGLGRSLGQGNGNLLQYSCLGNSMDRGDWRAAIHGVPKNQIRLSNYTAAACIHHIYFLSILPLMDPWVAFTFCLLWIILQWTWMYKYLSWFLLPVPLCIYSEVKFQNHMIVLVLIFWGATKMFSTAASPLYIPTTSVQKLQFLHLTHTCYFVFWQKLS